MSWWSMAASAAPPGRGRISTASSPPCKTLDDDETLLVQSGKPVGIFRTHKDAPRVLIANSNLVPHWATWDHFNELDKKGLAMYGQMTAGSWIYIGTQGIVQGTYETFAEAGRQHYGGNLTGRWILTGGLGGMGGAQPLAAVMAGACCLAVECDETRIDFRIRTRYVDAKAHTLDEALALIADWTREGRGEVGRPCSATRPTCSRNWCARMKAGGHRPDIVTDQTSAHDPLHGYLPQGWTVAEWRAKQETDPKAVEKAARASMRTHVAAMVDFWNAGVPTLDYGNNIRQVAQDEGLENAFAFPGFVPAYIRPLFCRGIGPFRWCALSGDPEDIHETDAAMKKLFPENAHLHRWLDMAQERIAFQGLPARICWIGLGDRHRAGLMFNEMVASGELKAPIVIGRDHLDFGSVASPNRETEAMKDGSDAVSDWPLAECAAEHRQRRHLGVAAPRRRRRAWASASIPAWSSSPTARRMPRGGCRTCSGTTRRRASCAMPMRAMTSRSTARASRACGCRVSWGTEGAFL